MIGLLGSMSAVAYQRTIIDIEMMFGLFFIVTMTLNFQYGNAGVSNMACALSASVGGYVVSACARRLIFWIGMQAGLDILPARAAFTRLPENFAPQHRKYYPDLC